jgi:peptide/nickel transport system ATP-binding protein/peptide/nickel transport system permease protein
MTELALAPEALPGGEPAGVTDAPRFVRRLLRRKLAVACIAYLAAIIVIAVIAPIVLSNIAHQNAGDLFAVRQGPSWHHLLGTDTFGRDVLDRLLVGSRVTMLGVGEALIVVLILGIPVGLAAGFLGGRIDRVVSWVADLAFSMPAIVIVLVVLSVFPQSMFAGMVTLGVVSAPALMRVVRSATLPVREELYIAAARVSGLSRPYIMTRHVLPRIAGPVIVYSSLLAAVALVVQTGLAFLNLLVAAPAPSWGGMVADGVSVIVLQPWLILPPGITIALTVLALGLLGDAVRDATTERWTGPAKRISGRRRMAADALRQELPAEPSDADMLVSVEHLSIAFATEAGKVRVVEDVSFEIRSGETLGLVGETGCGKTVTAMSILGLLPGTGEIEGGRIRFDGRDLTALRERDLRRIRGKEIAYVSQEPMIGLNPAFTVGWQLAEAVRSHHGASRNAARARAVELLRLVQLPEPETVARRYAHELSGGMAQRVAIARALAGSPRLLIADEPTTALDVTVQTEILDLLRDLQRDQQMTILLITHDWGVVADICDRAVVMYAGQIVERAEVTSVFREPLHPYTEALLASNPHNATGGEELPTIPGAVPKPGAWPTGCHFHPRCSYATAACRQRPIPLEHPSLGRETRCIHYDKLLRSR